MKQLGFMVLVWFLLTLPYWLTIVNSFSSPEGKEIAARSGLVLSHAMVANKLVLVATVLFAALSLYFLYYKNASVADDRWWWFCRE